MRISRIVRTSVCALMLTFVGTGTAQAATWTWAKSSGTKAQNGPIVMSGGGGYGDVVGSGLNTLTLKAAIRDTKFGDGNVYAHLVATRPSVSTGTSSGRRADGASTYAWVSDGKVTLTGGRGSWTLTVETCRTATLKDPCSDDKRTKYWP